MSGKQWTNTEDDFMRKHYPSESNPVICEKLGRSLRSVYSRAKILGLKKTAEFMQEQWQMLAENLQNNGKRYRFPKGNIPANKGKKMPANVYEKARKTMFRKGNIPANHKPIGYERINVDGYVEVKVAEPNKFRLKHRIVWEENFGTIPPGYNVQFRDKNRQNLQPDNLYLISRSDQLKKENSMYARYPKELQRAIQIKGALQRQINKFKKNE